MFIKLYNETEREDAFEFAKRIGGDLFQLDGYQLFHTAYPEGGDSTSACGDKVFAVTYTMR